MRVQVQKRRRSGLYAEYFAPVLSENQTSETVRYLVWVILANQTYPSRLARALWIEIFGENPTKLYYESRLARALWIEIPYLPYSQQEQPVEARESLVD